MDFPGRLCRCGNWRAPGRNSGASLAGRRPSGRLDRIERSVEETNTKGVRFKLPKNKASRRPIGIDGALVALLRGHKARQAETG